MRITVVSLLYIYGSTLDADGKNGVTRRQNTVTRLWNTCEHGTRGLNVREGSPEAGNNGKEVDNQKLVSA